MTTRACAIGAVLVGILSAGCGASRITRDATDGGSDAGADAVVDAVGATDASSDEAAVPPPDWTPITVYGKCKLERLAIPAGHQLFSWTPCEGIAGCEASTGLPQPTALPTAFGVQRGGFVSDDGTTTRATVIVDDDSDSTVYVVDPDGHVLDAYRTPRTAYDDECVVGITGIWGDRFGFVLEPVGPHDYATIVVEAVTQAGPPASASINAWLDFPMRMGTKRWAHANGSVVSFSNVTGGDQREVYYVAESSLAHNLRSAGDVFLFEAMHPGVGPTTIQITDGVSSAQQYLASADGSDYFAPAYAHSYVFFLRGVNWDWQSDTFDRVEIWDSPYSPDPAQLVPEKLADAPSVYWATLYDGGWGRLALVADDGTIEVWDAASRTEQSFTLPAGLDLAEIMGLTRHHLWITAARDTDGYRRVVSLIRYALD